ncbi:MAG: hypothetical protein ACREJC_06515 [Tepidisphaeraceae bacterium]
MAKAKTAPSTKAAKKKAGCRGTTISFKTKRGKTIEFKGKAGKACGPRRKPTPPPKHFRTEFARQAKACKGGTRGAFLKCMKRLQYS